MLKEGLTENKLSEDFTSKIKEVLEKAQAAYDQKDYKEASLQCEIALEMLDKLPEENKLNDLKLKALSMKGESVRFPIGVKEALKYYEQILGIHRKSGNKKAYANYLLGIGCEYSNAGKEQAALDAYTKAYE